MTVAIAVGQRGSRMQADPISIARKSYQAYVEKDRAAIEALIGDEFHFTSPLDNRIDRETYFKRCWPNSETIAGFEFVNLTGDGERAFVTYEGQKTSGERFRNTEILTVRNGKIVDVEVYFGWSIPHEAPAGGFIDA
jgi:ketosteroid isomerase-like protein